jgi:hypothetical protein
MQNQIYLRQKASTDSSELTKTRKSQRAEYRKPAVVGEGIPDGRNEDEPLTTR